MAGPAEPLLLEPGCAPGALCGIDMGGDEGDVEPADGAPDTLALDMLAAAPLLGVAGAPVAHA